MSRRSFALVVLVVAVVVVTAVASRDRRGAQPPEVVSPGAAEPGVVAGVSRSRRPGPARARRVGGIVTQGGKPLGGASVRLTRVGSAIVAGQANTGADGRFELGAHAVGAYLVVAEAPGLAAAYELVDLDDPGRRPDPAALALALGPCTVGIAGTVRDAGGGVIAGARVTFLVAHAAAGVTVTTTEAGAYRLCAPVAAASGRLRAEAEGYGTVDLPLVGPLPRAIERDLRLSPEAVVEGRVVDAAGAPLGGVTVRVGANALASGSTDAGGVFRIAGLPGGRHTLTVEGHLVEPAQEIAVLPGQSLREVVVTVRSLATLAGLVRRGGVPVAGARVATGPGLGAERAYSDAAGRFVLEGLRPGVTVSLEVGGEALATPVEVELDRLAVEGVILELVATRPLRGQVLLGGGGGRASVSAIGPAASVWVDSDEAGRFVLALPPGRYHVSAWRDGAAAASVPVEVAADADPAPLTLELATTGSLSGLLVDERGAPVPGLRVEARHGDASGMTSTSSDGAFTIAALPAGVPLELSAEQAGLGQAVAIVRVEPAAAPRIDPAHPHLTGLRVVVRWSARTISGRVETTAGEPLPDAHVMMGRGPHGEPHEAPGAPSAVSGTDGRFTLTGVPPGRHDLIVRSPDGERVVRAGIDAGAEGVVIRFARRGAIVAELVGFSAPPAELTAVRLCDPGHERGLPGCGAALAGILRGDHLHIDAVPPGRYAVRAIGNDERAGAEVEVGEGRTVEVRLESSGTGALRVRVVDWRTDQPLGGVRCSLMRERGRGELTTDAGGVASLERAPAGPSTVLCGGDGRFSDGRAELDMPAGGRADVEIALLVRGSGERASIGASFGGSPGLRVSAIDPGGPAERGGLAVGDTVVGIDGRSIERLHDNAAYALLLERPAGSRVRLMVRRDNQVRSLEIELGS